MFGRLGITSSLFGHDPKLEFRKPAQGMSLLCSPSPIPSTNSSYWKQYFTLFDSLSDVITLLDSSSLSRANPDNLKTLIEVTCDKLFSLLANASFPNSNRSRASASLMSTVTGTNDDSDDESRQVLNCIRVLSRVVPYLNPTRQEGESNTSELERQVFWTTSTVRVRRSTPSGMSGGPIAVSTRPNEEERSNEASQFVLEDEDDEEDEDKTPQPTPTKSGTSAARTEEEQYDIQQLPPLAERLLAALVDLAFVPGFTVPEECRAIEGGSVAYVIWEAGIAIPAASALLPTSPSLLSARIEVIRLLNILLSTPSLITPPHLFPVIANPWREAFVSSSLERKVVLCFLCSILNTALDGGAFAAAADPSSPAKVNARSGLLGVASGAAGRIGGVVMRLGSEDARGLLIQSCLQLLSILLSEHHSIDLSSSSLLDSNSFAYYLSKLHRPSDFDLIIRGVLNILDQAINEWPSILPRVLSSNPTTTTSGNTGVAAKNRVTTSVVTNALILLWRSAQLNPKLWKHLVRDRDELGGALFVHLMTFCLEYKDDETQLGLVRLSAFMMQSISAEPSLAARWNAPLELKLSLRGKYGVPGTLADFLIVSIYTLVFTTKGRLSPLYPAFILTISNASPHFKSLSTVSSKRLTQLFLALSAPNFLLMEEGNPRLVYYLLQAFNNIIHFQLSDNPELMLEVIKNGKRFDQLSRFSLAGAVEEVKKLKLERKKLKELKKQEEAGERGMKEKKPGEDRREGDVDEDGEQSEKARGKRRERDDSLSSLSGADMPPEGVASPSLALSVSMTSLALGEETLTREQSRGEETDTPFVGKNGFVPTESWVASWREGLPLDSILIAISELRPLILDLPNRSTSTSSTATTAVGVLSSASLTGLLPPPSEPKYRPFIFNPQSTTWLASIIYGNEYLAAFELLKDVPVGLFGVATDHRKGGVREAVERVGRGLRDVVSGGSSGEAGAENRR